MGLNGFIVNLISEAQEEGKAVAVETEKPFSIILGISTRYYYE